MTTSPESLNLLTRAAELRAAGTPWTDAAKKLAVPHDELRELASEYARDYDRLARRARTEFRRDATREALATLRDLMRSEELRVRLTAANTFVRYDIALKRHGTKKAGANLEHESRKLEREDRLPKTPTVDAQKVPVRNVSESPKVPTAQEVDAAKKVAQPPATPATPKPATPATPAAPVAPKQPAAPDDAEAARRRQLLVDRFALGRTKPLKRENAEAERLIGSWLSQ